jgi:polyvinyl alcohol dehydrogenase (cytochrome)
LYRRISVSFLLILACGLPIKPGDWPRYGGDASNRRFVSSRTRIDSQTVSSLKVDWREELRGCSSTPVVVNNVAYVGTWDGRVVALDVATGRVRWNAQVAQTQISASAFVSPTLVYIGDGSGVMHALDRGSGFEVWSRRLDDHPNAFVFSSPVLVDGMLVVGSAGNEIAIDKKEFSFRGSVVGLDPGNGEERWRVYTTANDANSGAGVSVWSSAAVDEKRHLVYIGTGNSYTAPASPLADGILAIDSRDGKLVWHRQFTKDDVYTIFQPAPQGPDADVGASPNLFRIGERDVVGVGDKAGVYSVLDRDTGETVWAARLTEGSHLGGVMVTASLDAQNIYVVSNVFRDTQFFANPENKALAFALSQSDGAVVWQRELPQPSFGAVTVANDVMFLTSILGAVRGLSTTTGDVVFERALDNPAGSGPTVVDDRLFVCDGYSFFTSGNIKGGLTAYAL